MAERVIDEGSIVAKRRRLRDIIQQNSLLKDREFLLVSGERSKYYFDMKMTTLHPEGAWLVGEVVFDYLKQFDFEYLGGLATGAIAPMVAICARSWPERPIKGFFVRDEAKDHGTRKLIDGFIEDGASAVVIEDVTTKGESALKAVRALEARGCKIVCVVSLVDRLEGAKENFKRLGIRFEAIFTTDDFR
ncbi:MAG: orotate phosphoribosyltransferase [Thiohalocapsa sp.]